MVWAHLGFTTRCDHLLFVFGQPFDGTESTVLQRSRIREENLSPLLVPLLDNPLGCRDQPKSHSMLQSHRVKSALLQTHETAQNRSSTCQISETVNMCAVDGACTSRRVINLL
ncbi:hypothetical protein MTP99_017701 [Tenebrio molitor]|nr:hypothetical protein MTP99_017701 [Tenebrio molitor]